MARLMPRPAPVTSATRLTPSSYQRSDLKTGVPQRREWQHREGGVRSSVQLALRLVKGTPEPAP
jgi:hypothetical protein